jgi:hypothetical protein
MNKQSDSDTYLRCSNSSSSFLLASAKTRSLQADQFRLVEMMYGKRSVSPETFNFNEITH